MGYKIVCLNARSSVTLYAWENDAWISYAVQKKLGLGAIQSKDICYWSWCTHLHNFLLYYVHIFTLSGPKSIICSWHKRSEMLNGGGTIWTKICVVSFFFQIILVCWWCGSFFGSNDWEVDIIVDSVIYLSFHIHLSFALWSIGIRCHALQFVSFGALFFTIGICSTAL